MRHDRIDVQSTAALVPIRALIVQIQGQLFAIAAQDVRHVDHCGPASVLPFVPSWVEGLVEVGGRILPSIDLACMLGLPARTGASGQQAVLAEGPHGDIVLKVDMVRRLVDIPPELLDDRAPVDTDTIIQTCPDRFIVGQFLFDKQMVLLLDVQAITLSPTMNRIGEGGGSRKAVIQDTTRVGQPTHERLPRIATLVISVSDQAFAFPLETVREIHADIGVTPVPGSPDYVAGLSLVRGETMLRLSLAILLGLPRTRDAVPAAATIACNVGELDVLLDCDRIVGIVRYEADQCRPVGEPDSAQNAILIGDDGSMVTMLQPERLLNAHQASALRQLVPHRHQAAVKAAVGPQAIRVLLAMVGKELCALPIGDVDRVVAAQGAAVLPRNGSICAGVTEVAGHILPVADLHTIAGCTEPDSNASLVVVRVRHGQETTPWALRVSRVLRMADLPLETLRADYGTGLFSSVGRIGGQMVNLLDVHALEGEFAGEGA